VGLINPYLQINLKTKEKMNHSELDKVVEALWLDHEKEANPLTIYRYEELIPFNILRNQDLKAGHIKAYLGIYPISYDEEGQGIGHW
jgi:hypothetical protein